MLKIVTKDQLNRGASRKQIPISNHPPIENLTTNHIGFRHGTRFPDGRAVAGYIDGHVGDFTRQLTNGIIIEFKQ